MPPHVKNKKKKQKKEEKAAAAAVPAAAAAIRARAHKLAAAAALSQFAETFILDYLDDVKPHNQARNAGLAHKLWLEGTDDHLIERWQQQQQPAPRPSQEETLTANLQTADWLLRKANLTEVEKLWLPAIIDDLATRPELAGTVAQLKGLL